MPKLPRSTLAPARTEVLREGRGRHDLVLLHAELLRDDAWHKKAGGVAARSMRAVACPTARRELTAKPN